jgi:Cys-tRNA(Pro)/Cys-tRNA(Cys) deacylase
MADAGKQSKKRSAQTGSTGRMKTTPATTALGKAGVPYALHAYRHDPRVKEYGREAADELGFEPRRVFKTLVASVDGELVVAVVPVSGKLDLKALAATVGGKRAEMADTAAAERATGYKVGGISPLGQRTKLPTIVDSSAMDFESILVSAGRRGLDLEIMPDLLVVTLNARTAPIYRED